MNGRNLLIAVLVFSILGFVCLGLSIQASRADEIDDARLFKQIDAFQKKHEGEIKIELIYRGVTEKHKAHLTMKWVADDKYYIESLVRMTALTDATELLEKMYHELDMLIWKSTVNKK